jgi:hypothetical protein
MESSSIKKAAISQLFDERMRGLNIAKVKFAQEKFNVLWRVACT